MFTRALSVAVVLTSVVAASVAFASPASGSGVRPAEPQCGGNGPQKPEGPTPPASPPKT